MELTARKSELGPLLAQLSAQSARKLDLVVPSRQMLYMTDGELSIRSAQGPYRLRPNSWFKSQIASKLGIPYAYFQRMEQEQPVLLSENVNTWLRAEDTKQLIRAYTPENGDQVGVARAFLSDRYKVMDNEDVVLSVLEGIRKADVKVKVESADITDRRVYVRFYSEEIALRSDMLTVNYSRFGRSGREFPMVFAGFVLSNSEVGSGAFALVPRVVLQVCINGHIVNLDAMRNTHLGARLEEGVVTWSDATREKNLGLIQSQAEDAVQTFLSKPYVQNWIDLQDPQAKMHIPTPESFEVVERIQKNLGWTDATRQGVLSFFLESGDRSVFGLRQAITAQAQEMSDGDAAHELEASANKAGDLALDYITK